MTGALGACATGCANDNPVSACPQSLQIAALLRPLPGSTTPVTKISTLEFSASVAAGSSYHVELIPVSGETIDLTEIASRDPDGIGSDIDIPAIVPLAQQMTYTVRLAASYPPPCGGPVLAPPASTFHTQ